MKQNIMRQNIIRLLNGVHKTSVILAMILLVLMTSIIILNVFMRYVLNSGLQWAEEVAKLLMAWLTFICFAIGIKEGLHISLSILKGKLQARLRVFLIILKSLVVLTIASVFLVYGIKLIGFTSQSIMPATKWPSSTLYMILPFTAALIIFAFFADLLEKK